MGTQTAAGYVGGFSGGGIEPAPQPRDRKATIMNSLARLHAEISMHAGYIDGLAPRPSEACGPRPPEQEPTMGEVWDRLPGILDTQSKLISELHIRLRNILD
jgi:hypothetical protein